MTKNLKSSIAQTRAQVIKFTRYVDKWGRDGEVLKERAARNMLNIYVKKLDDLRAELKKNKAMTWKELKNRIEKMPEEEQEKNATVWAEEEPIRDAVLSRCTEDLYGNNEWDFAVYKSDLEKEELNDPGTYLIARKGHYYLDFE